MSFEVLHGRSNVDFVSERYRNNETIKAATRELEIGITSNYIFLTWKWSILRS